MNKNLVIAIAAVVVFAVGIILFINRKEIHEFFDKKDNATLVVHNLTPYPIEFAIQYQQDKSTQITEGWTRIGVGESKSVYREILEEDSDFLVCVRSVKGEEHFKRAYETNDSGAYIVWDGDISANVDDSDFKYLNYDYDSQMIEMPFAIQHTELKSRNYRKCSYVVTDDAFHQCYPAEELNSVEDFIAASSLKAKSFANALELQSEFDGLGWSGGRIPYFLGCEIVDVNGPREKGVQLRNVVDQTIFQQPMPLEHEDNLLRFNYNEVYGIKDLKYYLLRHARSQYRGIESPYNYGLERDNSYYSGKVTYFFNPKYYGISQEDKNKAFIRGASKAWTMGLDKYIASYAPGVINGGKKAGNWLARKINEYADTNLGQFDVREGADPAELKWKYIQESVRLMQFYPDAFDGGQLIGMFSPSLGRTIFVKSFRAVAGKSAAKGIGRIASTIAAETLETAIWTAMDAPPEHSTKQILNDIKSVIPYTAGIGFATSYIFKGR